MVIPSFPIFFGHIFRSRLAYRMTYLWMNLDQVKWRRAFWRSGLPVPANLSGSSPRTEILPLATKGNFTKKKQQTLTPSSLLSSSYLILIVIPYPPPPPPPPPPPRPPPPPPHHHHHHHHRQYYGHYHSYH